MGVLHHEPAPKRANMNEKAATCPLRFQSMKIPRVISTPFASGC